MGYMLDKQAELGLPVYLRYPAIGAALKARIERNSTPVPVTGCWLWTGSAVKKGYGRTVVATNDGPQTVAIHRAYYQIVNGPIPPGYVLDHLCRVPSCFNPDHLQIVTYKENAVRGLKCALKTHCNHGHAYVENAGINKKGFRFCKQCYRDRSKKAYWDTKNRRLGNV